MDGQILWIVPLAFFTGAVWGAFALAWVAIARVMNLITSRENWGPNGRTK